MIKLLYPDTRTVSEDTVRGWLVDAIDNGEIDLVIDPNKEEIDHVCELLMETGKVTFEMTKE